MNLTKLPSDIKHQTEMIQSYNKIWKAAKVQLEKIFDLSQNRNVVLSSNMILIDN